MKLVSVDGGWGPKTDWIDAWGCVTAKPRWWNGKGL